VSKNICSRSPQSILARSSSRHADVINPAHSAYTGHLYRVLASIPPDGIACLGHREGQKTPSDQPFQTDVSRPKRVLVVEDEPLVALMMADDLVELGYNVVGPAFTISEARHLAQMATLHAAIIDLTQHGIFAGEVADTLSRRQIPFLFIIGYDRPPPGFHDGVGFLNKPFRVDDLRRAVGALIGSTETLGPGSAYQDGFSGHRDARTFQHHDHENRSIAVLAEKMLGGSATTSSSSRAATLGRRCPSW
jgi:CheY-like chemotaxis protein